jgi:hypothetical protein
VGQTVTVPRAAITTEPAPAATLGKTDATRRWALRFPDDIDRFAGITRVEADTALPVLETLETVDLARALVRIELGVVLSEGAGPYLVDAIGSLVLVVGGHDAAPDVSVAIGEARPGHDIGLVSPVGSGVWVWRAMVAIAPADRIAALDALAACADLAAARGWERAWRRSPAVEPGE